MIFAVINGNALQLPTLKCYMVRRILEIGEADSALEMVTAIVAELFQLRLQDLKMEDAVMAFEQLCCYINDIMQAYVPRTKSEAATQSEKKTSDIIMGIYKNMAAAFSWPPSVIDETNFDTLLAFLFAKIMDDDTRVIGGKTYKRFAGSGAPNWL